MHVLYPDVLELILKRLPIETRVALRVRPNRVRASDELKQTVERMARIASHPNQLCFVLARVKDYDKPIKVISSREVCTDIFTGVRRPSYRYVTACRTRALGVGSGEFMPFVYWNPDMVRCANLGQPVYDWYLEALQKYEKLGEITHIADVAKFADAAQIDLTKHPI